MDWHGRIVIDPPILDCKPVLKGTRLTPELQAASRSEQKTLDNCPQPTAEDIGTGLACPDEADASVGAFQRFCDAVGSRTEGRGLTEAKLEELLRVEPP
jgi:hypothetical protein